jgi:hypothetical protein
MLTKAKVAVAAALMLGAVSAAQAANDNQSRDRGGIDIGPLGQCFDPSACGGYRYHRHPYAYGAYGFVPEGRYHYRHWRHEW